MIRLKYGIEKMYGLYTGDIPIREGALWLKNVEEVADDFAFRKIRELMKSTDKIKLNYSKLNKVYDNLTIKSYENLVNYTISLIKKSEYKDKNEISEILYNNIINSPK